MRWQAPLHLSIRQLLLLAHSSYALCCREPLLSAQTALKMTAEMAAEQARVQRAAAALAQRKAVAARAAEEALWQGQGLKGPKHKQLPSAAFVSQTRQQVSRSLPVCLSVCPSVCPSVRLSVSICYSNPALIFAGLCLNCRFFKQFAIFSDVCEYQ